MKVEGYVFSAGFVFLSIASTVYWFLSKDPTGTTAVAMASGLMLIIGTYLLFTARRIEPRPEDRDAEIADGDPEVGFFSPSSHWPIGIAAGAAILGMGFVFGLWLAVIGFAVLIVMVVGLLFQYYGGEKVS